MMNATPFSALPSWATAFVSTLRELAAPTQTTRLIQLSTALPEAALVVTAFTGEDHVSAICTTDIDCISVSTDWQLADLLDHEITLRVLQADGSYRHQHGYVRQAWQVGADGGVARYHLQMVPWLSLLDGRQDCYVFQDQSVQDILVSVFSEYPQAKFRFEVSSPGTVKALCTQFNESDLLFVQRLMAEAGWSYRFEHDQQSAVSAEGVTAHAHHTLVIFDRFATLPDCAQNSIRFHRGNATERSDTMQSLQQLHSVVPNVVTVQSFDDRALASPAAQATDDFSALLGTQCPAMELFAEASPGLYLTQADAQAAADLVLAALTVQVCEFSGISQVRALQAGTRFTLTQHDRYTGNDARFTVTGVTHHAVNNLGTDAARLLDHPELKDGTYRNEFWAIPASVPLVKGSSALVSSGLCKSALNDHAAPVCIGPFARPRHARLDTALVVGVESEAITTTREHRVKVQFAWQRGLRPNAGGLNIDNEFDEAGRAPGNEQAGIWVRVGTAVAGPNFGSVFVPRIGTEVVIDYLHQDIDCPIITGQLYNGEDLPPFSAGQNSAANHPGVLKGIHTQGLNNPDQYNQWQSDATPNQLRTRLLSSTANSALNLGYLIDQPPTTAIRGAYRGQGAELRTDGWLVTRMGEGMLISSTARPDQTYSAQGSQMDVQEAVAQLKGGQDLQQRLSDAAQQAQALTPGVDTIKHSIETIDVNQQGKYTGPMNGQATTLPSGSEGATRFSGGDAVPKFAKPHLLLDTPDDRLNATPASLVQYAADNLTHLTQGHRHDISQYTHSQISGQATSFFAQQGGLQFIAANGPVSIQAHTGELSALSKDALTITSSNGEIEIKAPSQITLIAGDTKIELNGANVTLSTSGELNLKGTLKQIAKGLSGGTTLPYLPQGLVEIPRTDGVPTFDDEEVIEEHYELTDGNGNPVKGYNYKIINSDSETKGLFSSQGKTESVVITGATSKLIAWLDPKGRGDNQ
jgi:type VI secretion system secreted protein VgrG